MFSVSFMDFLGAVWGFLAFLILLIIYKLYIKVRLDMQYYVKQGAVPIFHKKLLGTFSNSKNAIEKGDFFYRYKELARQHPEAKCFVENFGNKILLVPVENKMIREFLSKYEVYHKARSILGLTSDLIEGSLSFLEGNSWKKHRKNNSAAFHYEFLKNVTPMMVKVTEEKFKEWIITGEIDHLDVLHQMGTITGEVVGRFFYGQRFSDERIWGLPLTAAAQQLLERLGKEAFSLTNVILGPNFARRGILKRHKELNNDIKDFRAKCRGLIEELEKNGIQEQNLLKMLLEQKNLERAEGKLTNEQIVGRFIGLFIAGTDTTALLLNSALYNIGRYPEAAKKLREEIEREITDFGSFTIDTLNKLEYTTAFLKETLRYGSSIGNFFLRVASKDDDLCGVHVKKGTMINVYVQVPHYNENNFSDPYEFLPERWLSGDKDLKADDHAFVSFSAGPRSCIGQHFGMIESKIVLAMLLRNFDIEIPKDYKMVLVTRITLTPLEPFVIKLKPKNSNMKEDMQTK